MTISLGSINFNNDVPDANGTLWYVEVDGWDNMVNRVAEIDIPARHGSVTTQNLFSARQLTLTGVASALDNTKYWLAYNELQTVTNSLTRFVSSPLLLTQTEDVSKYLTVLRTGLNVRCIDYRVLQFELTLRADDPFKYASTASTLTTSGNAINAGNAATYPTFTLSSTGAPTLTAGAFTWSASSLPSGTVIDFRRFTVTNGSTNYAGNVAASSSWLSFAPGTTAVTASVAGTWSWRSAWM